KGGWIVRQFRPRSDIGCIGGDHVEHGLLIRSALLTLYSISLEMSTLMYQSYRITYHEGGGHMQLTTTMREEIGRSVLCWLATVSADGTSNVSPKEMGYSSLK